MVLCCNLLMGIGALEDCSYDFCYSNCVGHFRMGLLGPFGSSKQSNTSTSVSWYWRERVLSFQPDHGPPRLVTQT